MKVDSHVQLPKSIINNFRISKENGNVYVLNLDTREIEEKGPKKIGIKYGHYNEMIEELLCKKYEHPLSLIKNKLEKWNQDHAAGMLSEEEIETIKSFLKMLICRDPQMIEDVYSGSVLAKFFGIKPSASDIVRYADKINLNNKYFADNYPVIIFNNTKVPFVTSISGVYLWKSEFGGNNWWFPLTPIIAIHFVDKYVFEEMYNNSTCADLFCEDEVKQMNKNIMLQDKSIFRIIISNDKNELERLNYDVIHSK